MAIGTGLQWHGRPWGEGCCRMPYTAGDSPTPAAQNPCGLGDDRGGGSPVRPAPASFCSDTGPCSLLLPRTGLPVPQCSCGVAVPGSGSDPR